MPKRAGRETDCWRLVTCDQTELLVQDPVEGIRIRSRCPGHEGMMRARSDKALLRKCRKWC